jgi:purine-binding chemotaxis protein CheW
MPLPPAGSETEPGGARGVGAGTNLALICRVRDRLCGLPLGPVVETMRPLPVRSLVAGAAASIAAPFVMGVAMIRGAATPVVDVGALLGAGDAAAPTRFVTVRSGARRVALSVESVLGVRELPASSLRELPPLLRDASADVVAAVGTLDAELLVVLRTARLLPESLWAAVATAGAVRG